jgi:hypothetical protein
MQETKEASNEFLNELRIQFERDLDIKKTLDSKATNMITMSGTIVTILIAIGTFLLTRLESTSNVFHVSLWILAVGIVLAITCIVLQIFSYSLKKYTFPMGHESFFVDGEFNKEMSEKFRNAPKDQFTKRMVEEYLVSIKNFSKVNAKKARLIKIGQWCFVSGIIAIAVLLGYVLYGPNINFLNL